MPTSKALLLGDVETMVDYRCDPAVQVFGDTAASVSRMSESAKAAGMRVLAAREIGAKSDPAPRLSPGALLLVELEHDSAPEAVIALLDLVGREAARGARRGVVSAPLALIDLVAARVGDSAIEHLCDAGDEERVAAVRRAASPRESRLHDSRRDRDFPILQPLPEARLASQGRHAARVDAAYIRMLLRTRRLRTHFFRSDLFADPAWDMLLDLMAARLEGKQVAVSSLCIAAAVPPTTALRWIGVLTESGLVVRVADRNDGRRVYIELAEPTARALAAWLDEARRMLGELC